MGTCWYYRKFVKDFGKLAQPLTMMTRKTEPERVQWTSEGEQAFVALRKSLCNKWMLTIPALKDFLDCTWCWTGCGTQRAEEC